VIGEASERGLGVIYIDHNVDHVAPCGPRDPARTRPDRRHLPAGERSADELRELIARTTRHSSLASREGGGE
jgi:hypothetical protein